MTTTDLERRRHPAPEQRMELGRQARVSCPPESNAEYAPSPDRKDLVQLMLDQAATRLPDLVPVRHGRMLASPFAFYRGAAAVMAMDLAPSRVSGLPVQLCGDAHLSNFGVFASPERRLLFDINDFDETTSGPFEWDVKRLAASLAMAGRQNGFDDAARRKIVLATTRSYKESMAAFAGMRKLDIWYARAEIDQLREMLAGQLTKARQRGLDRTLAKARDNDSLKAFSKLTEVVDGHRRIKADPPLLVPIQSLLPDIARAEIEGSLHDLLDGYRTSLESDRKVLFDAFEFVDLARKVVGVGSVGTRCWIVLFLGRDESDPLFLQVKEAGDSVLTEYVPLGLRNPGEPAHGGQRVVAGQRLMQAASDIFLGWQTVEGLDGQTRDFYVRQLRDQKGAAVVEEMVPRGMRLYGELCGWTLARAHARAGDPIAMAAYLGEDDAFPTAIAEFSERYADQTERDYDVLVQAVSDGRLEAEPGL
jgi:uncharacterized protein (DUF2252 family)